MSNDELEGLAPHPLTRAADLLQRSVSAAAEELSREVTSWYLEREQELVHTLEALPELALEARRHRGLSLRSAAREIGISFPVLARLERGNDVMLSNALAVLRWLA